MSSFVYGFLCSVLSLWTSSILLHIVVNIHSHCSMIIHYVNIAQFVCFAVHGHLGNSQMGTAGYYDIAVTGILVQGVTIFLLEVHRGVEWLGRSVCICLAL